MIWAATSIGTTPRVFALDHSSTSIGLYQWGHDVNYHHSDRPTAPQSYWRTIYWVDGNETAKICPTGWRVPHLNEVNLMASMPYGINDNNGDQWDTKRRPPYYNEIIVQQSNTVVKSLIDPTQMLLLVQERPEWPVSIWLNENRYGHVPISHRMRPYVPSWSVSIINSGHTTQVRCVR